MRTVERRWMNLIRDQKHIYLSRFLLELDVISTPMFKEFLDVTHQTFRDYQLNKESRKLRTESREYSTQRPPRHIKPTKQRRF